MRGAYKSRNVNGHGLEWQKYNLDKYKGSSSINLMNCSASGYATIQEVTQFITYP